MNDDYFFYEEIITPLLRNQSEPVKLCGLKCNVCGKMFPNRSRKYQHRNKFEKGTFCNVPTPKGRPGYETEEERKENRRISRLKQKRNLKLKRKGQMLE